MIDVCVSLSASVNTEQVPVVVVVVMVVFVVVVELVQSTAAVFRRHAEPVVVVAGRRRPATVSVTSSAQHEPSSRFDVYWLSVRTDS